MAKSKKTDFEWQVTTDRYVAFIDIMGFKNMVERSTHDEIYEMMKKIDETIKHNTTIKWPNINDILIKTNTFSDSILMYSKDASSDYLHSIIFSVSSLTYDLLAEGIPHKGALAFGRMTLDTINSIVFGRPLIDAYLLQEELNFYSIILHASAEFELSKVNTTGYFPFIFKYMCPLKNGTAEHLTIAPIYLFDYNEKHKSHRQKVLDSIQKFRFTTSGYLRKYVDNTENYLNAIK